MERGMKSLFARANIRVAAVLLAALLLPEIHYNYQVDFAANVIGGKICLTDVRSSQYGHQVQPSGWAFYCDVAVE
jgi:hypothetical protein